MIDSHCHLTDPRLFDQLDAVLSRAAAAGVTQVVTIGTEPDDARAAIELCRRHLDMLRCAIGVHPNYCHEVGQSALQTLRDLQADPCVVALGEMGLDYHHNFADRARQRVFFEAQLQLAAELNRPVVIHCREAIDDTLAVLRDFPGIQAVFHCFTGTIAEGERVLGAGHLLGFTGAVTFKKSDDLRDLARRAPDDRLLIETDAPYLTPEPMRRQKVNEPALVVQVARVVADARNAHVDQINQITTTNARRFFRWDE
jgi:TatD DNase family protein